MAGIKRRTIKITPDLLREIEYVLPKLKYSAYINHIKNWLENFEEEDQKYAIDFLFYLEYIPFNELQARIVALISNDIVRDNPGKKFLFLPFAKYGKSCEVIIYLLSHSTLFKELASRGRARFERYNKENPLTPEPDEIVVFIDDFIGSGRSFKRDYEKEGIGKFISDNYLYDGKVYYLAAVVFEKAVEYLKYKFIDIKVVGDLRSRIFSSVNSPFILGHGPLKMKSIALKYGNDIEVYSKAPMFQPFGFNNTEALVAFDHSTPNNTLPIIWGDKKWYPIYPRLDLEKMDQAKALKREAAFYIGIMNRLKLDLYKLDTLSSEERRTMRYNKRIDYSVIALMLLKEKKFPDIMICQVLGITSFELNTIYGKSLNEKLTNADKEMTLAGINFVAQLWDKAAKKRIRKKDRSIFKRKNYIYVPNKFEGIA
jgi:hypothetical protein